MAERTTKKTIGRRKAAPKAAPKPKVKAKAEPRSRPSPPPPEAAAAAAGSSWEDLADRAAKKFGELVDKATEAGKKAAEKASEAGKKAAEKAGPAAEKAAEAGKKMAVDLSGGVDDAFGKISDQAKVVMQKGQHTRVRIKFRGKQLAELPVAVVAAAEVASLWWFGPLRLLLGHVVGKAVLDVEFVSNADAHVAEGRAFLADGELDRAMAAFDKALTMDSKSAGAHLGRGIALKLRGDKAAAKKAFEESERCDPYGEPGREARRHLDNLA